MSIKSKILLSGATGFVGESLLSLLSDETHVVGRTKPIYPCVFFNLDMLNNPDYSDALSNVEVVIHSAARTHMMNKKFSTIQEQLDEYQKINNYATIAFAKQASLMGVKRFIFISSIKVHGESTNTLRKFTSVDKHAPEDFYGKSKSEAEVQLQALGNKTGMEIVIIRPTLVYGPGVKANFASLMNLVYKGVPLPFGCITQNKRSLVSVVNLVDLIITCIDHPKAANQVFLVSDDHDVSTSEMVREMAKALGKPAWQLPIPIWCYKLVGKLFNKSDVVDRLTGSLQVDISHTKNILGWKPPQTLQEGFKQTAQAFLQAKTK
ncbi:SDR family oxidoreductase [Shewanella sp. 8A]|uniref:UDP-glucose 4-epimerase family protein n=1 Tax=Shewanella sp. 8A TaxID=2943323 RepID=UPI00201B2B0B|nr:SDR family oxidoreductase [Shewanella sp. 8A]